MKVIIAGGRNVKDYNLLLHAIKASTFTITQVVSGGCTGVDHMGEQWARMHGWVPKLFHVNYQRDGLGAGPKRNRIMAEYADALIAIWDGKSVGTGNIIKQMMMRKKPIYIEKYLGEGRVYVK